MDSIDMQLLDFARQKGGWFTSRDACEVLGFDYTSRGAWVLRHLHTLTKYGFLTMEARNVGDTLRMAHFFRDAEADE